MEDSPDAGATWAPFTAAADAECVAFPIAGPSGFDLDRFLKRHGVIPPFPMRLISARCFRRSVDAGPKVRKMKRSYRSRSKTSPASAFS